MEIQEQKQGFFHKLKRFYIECVRVLRVTKKPTNEEYKTISKVTALGVLIIGAIGFVIIMIKELIF